LAAVKREHPDLTERQALQEARRRSVKAMVDAADAIEGKRPHQGRQDGEAESALVIRYGRPIARLRGSETVFLAPARNRAHLFRDSPDGRAGRLRYCRMFCLDDGGTLEALFVFAAFVLGFAIGLGLGLLTRGPAYQAPAMRPTPCLPELLLQRPIRMLELHQLELDLDPPHGQLDQVRVDIRDRVGDQPHRPIAAAMIYPKPRARREHGSKVNFFSN
jgi:hypothetical protein